jgi:hypothetical protein
MEPHGGISGGDVQGASNLGEARAVDVHAADDVLIGRGQGLHQRERARADRILSTGRLEVEPLGKWDLTVPLAKSIEGRIHDDPADPSVDTHEVAHGFAALESAKRGALVDLACIERGKAPTTHALEVVAKAG